MSDPIQSIPTAQCSYTIGDKVGQKVCTESLTNVATEEMKAGSNCTVQSKKVADKTMEVSLMCEESDNNGDDGSITVPTL